VGLNLNLHCRASNEEKIFVLGGGYSFVLGVNSHLYLHLAIALYRLLPLKKIFLPPCGNENCLINN